MKKLVLTDQFKKVEDIQVGDKLEKFSTFFLQTMNIVNSGQIQYNDVRHYKAVRKAIKALTSQKAEPTIVLEDADYRLLYGTDDNPGFIQRYTGWMSGDATDEYIDIWENAEQQSIISLKKELIKVK